MSDQTAIRIASEAGDLIHRALFELRETLRERIVANSEMTVANGRQVPAKTAFTRTAIECECELIELVRDLETHQAGSPYNGNLPWDNGPQWLEEIIAQGPSWAGGAT